mmetsp:Transcript_68159/g.197586  ORF Transcript_68159/g.197586 Transcript_68159/m.197586 type:complete len:340 (+) Transcript_68159:156-1175(+)
MQLPSATMGPGFLGERDLGAMSFGCREVVNQAGHACALPCSEMRGDKRSLKALEQRVQRVPAGEIRVLHLLWGSCFQLQRALGPLVAHPNDRRPRQRALEQGRHRFFLPVLYLLLCERRELEGGVRALSGSLEHPFPESGIDLARGWRAGLDAELGPGRDLPGDGRRSSRRGLPRLLPQACVVVAEPAHLLLQGASLLLDLLHGALQPRRQVLGASGIPNGVLRTSARARGWRGRRLLACGARTNNLERTQELPALGRQLLPFGIQRVLLAKQGDQAVQATRVGISLRAKCRNLRLVLREDGCGHVAALGEVVWRIILDQLQKLGLEVRVLDLKRLALL